MGVVQHFIAATVALGFTGIGAAQAAQRSWMVTNFDRIEVGGPYEVHVAVGKGQSVRAEGAQRDLDRLDVRVVGERLRIKSKDRLSTDRGNDGPVQIWVTVPQLRAAMLAGSGRMGIDRVKAIGFDAGVAGTGTMSIAAIDAETVSFSIAGSGDLTAAGRCRNAELAVAGSGEAHVGKLACQTLAARVMGTGDVEAHASRSAELVVMGSGSVVVRGGAKCEITKIGSGQIDCGR